MLHEPHVRESHFSTLFEFAPYPCLELDLSGIRQAVDLLAGQAADGLRVYLQLRPHETDRLAALARVVRANRDFLEAFELRQFDDAVALAAKPLPEPSRPAFATAMAELSEGKTHIELDAGLVTGKGHERDFAMRLRVLPGSETTWSRIAAAFHDVTTEKAEQRKVASLELQLGHAARLATLGELAAGIAHEVNQPLCSIANFATACRNASRQPVPQFDRIAEWNEAIASAAARAGEIVRRYCSFARRSEVEYSVATIDQLVDDALRLVRLEAESRRVAIAAELPEERLAVHVDPVQICQVLVNLLRNAIEALDSTSSAARQIVVAAGTVDSAVEVSVSDNGPGLPAVASHDVFQPFFSKKPHGLGLGLAISKTIVEAHGGQIWATANPNGGVAFHFTLQTAEGN